ncbi:disulfide bond formation protein DsbB [Hasllibacter halocynthiae]|uniref:Disulfide bond formation protein DsbB n=1 Tax=Hasllibacter halocynthiae TaxID=595589 RepID=A0A2T0X855_9RHOB|nr:disulfide bond formation protein B [Hasllibacter halocynthiae]PRY95113.1 disulfide bond formation protein DsbB [Hasllibacter halocynthiae]
MQLDARRLAILAAAGSAALLAGAYLFQAMGFAPCRMCHWQRWPHMAAIALGVLVWALRPGAPPMALRLLAALGALAAATTAGIGVFHAGVERGWWAGPASCTGTGGLAGLGGADLLSLEGPGVAMCDVVEWWFLGLSMASWNAILSAGLAALWLLAALRAGRGVHATA